MRASESFGLFCHPGDTVIDIGAHVGKTTAVMSKLVGERGRVFAIEAHPAIFPHLSSSVTNLNMKNVSPILRAVSNENGFCDFFSATSPGHDQASTIMPELANEERLGRNIISFRTESEKLDSICSRFSLSPSFIKIDVEGAEHLVFEGAYNVINSIRPSFYFECGFQSHLPQHCYYLPNFDYVLLCSDIFYFKNKWISMEFDRIRNIVVPISDNFTNFLPHGCAMNIIACHMEIFDSIKENMVILTDESFFNIVRTIYDNT